MARGVTKPVATVTQADGAPPASCAGFHNQTGVSDAEIRVANASDLSGPIPGLFIPAEQGAAAYAAYFNSTSSVCGRKLRVDSLDTQTSSTGNQDAATTACSADFAMVGSVSAYDSGGAQTVEQCGIPELASVLTTPQRYASPASFGVDSINPTSVESEPWRFVKAATGTAYQKAALIYLDAAAVIPNAMADKKTAESVGYNFVYEGAISVEAFNFAPDRPPEFGPDRVRFDGLVEAVQFC